MNLHKCILTKNNCYKAGKKLVPKGIMVHSTAANNTSIGRYVPNYDGLLSPNRYNNHWDQPTPDGRQICCHAFIGKMADGSIATYQTLPWDMRGWHGASGLKGSCNTTHIGFEICEDDTNNKVYLQQVYAEAVDLCVYLCKLYNLTEKDIICHAEGYKLGIASNHSDIEHWWHKHGITMDQFRKDVGSKLKAQNTNAAETNVLYRVQVGAFASRANAEAYLAKVKKEFPDAFITKIQK